jgi:hypothetical protein
MIQIDLKPEVEAQLIAEAQAQGVEPSVYAGGLIERAYLHMDRLPTDDLRTDTAPRLSRKPGDVRAWLDSLTQFSDRIPQLPDEAFTRESFYQDRD